MAGTTTGTGKITEKPRLPTGEELALIETRSAGEMLGRERSDDRDPEEREASLEIQEARESAVIAAEAVERAQAASSGVSWALWQTFDRQQRRVAIKEARDRQAVTTPGDARARQIPRTEQAIPEALVSALHTREDFQTLVEDFRRQELAKTHIPMCDPPVLARVDGEVKLYHGGVSFIPLKAMDQKRRQGFSVVPRYDFLPPPGFACDASKTAVGITLAGCPWSGYSEDEVQQHVAAYHPTEFKARQERVRSEQVERQIAQMRAQTDAILAQGAALSALTAGNAGGRKE